ncbi:MAG TPA: hypothetical protein VFW33_23970, partial [Gemmataceae bacterium]|nr:hypothetical protein [Gemmataceae bacterium]
AAACLLAAVALKNLPAHRADPVAPPAPDEEVLTVLSPDEVDIVSMDDRDRGALVVGRPPVDEPMELLTQDEVSLDKLPDAQGRVVRLHVSPGPGAPFVVVSVGQPDPDTDP